MWIFRRTIGFLCPARSREAKLAGRFVCAQEAESCPYRSQPPNLECP